MLQLFIDSAWNGLRRALAPACLLCAGGATEHGLCAGCHGDLPRLGTERCPVCAAPTPGAQTCGRCLQQPPRFDRVIAACTYSHPIDILVRMLKYDGNLAAARPLATVLADALEAEPYPDLIIAMPLAKTRLTQRGFNQALALARPLCREFGLQIAHDAVQRSRAGVPQASLPWKERNKNVRGVFVCQSDLSGKRVAVMDDVLTSGATLDSLAGELKRAGAAHVTGWIAARTVRPG
jgi:ComF family protein